MASQTDPSKATNEGKPEDDDDVPHFLFSEEPLGLPASEGFGYFQGGPGLSIGPKNRFLIQSKLGLGSASSVWLAKDLIENKHVAIKILTGHATQLNKENKLRELEVHQRLSSVKLPHPDRCVHLGSHFFHQGIEHDGEHLCLVLELCKSNIRYIQNAFNGEWIPIPTVKRILRQVLQGIANLHECGIAHTDIKQDNIMVDLEDLWSTGAIDSWVKENPHRTYPPERSLYKMVSSIVTQPFPPPTFNELSSRNFKLADFSNAQFVDDQTTDDIIPLDLRPPEVVLGGEWNELVDIWSYGCTVFTLLTNQPLFKPIPSPEDDASEIDVLLHQMILFCGESFPEALLRRCTRTLDYFRLDCLPKKFKQFPRKTFQQRLLDGRPALDPAEAEAVASLMAQCLRIDPKDRSTAQELLKHPWLTS